jgi:hypothetical protein
MFSLHPDDCRSTAMGQDGEDVQLSKAAREKFPYQIEAKARHKVAIYGFYDQAMAHGSHEPVVFIKADRREPLVVVDAIHFIELVKKAGENHG